MREMATPPEIMHTADIPEAESEVQDALMARMERGAKRSKNRPKQSRARKAKAEVSTLTPILSQLPRNNGVARDKRGRILKGSVSPARGSVWREVQKYAEVYAFEAVDFLVQVMRDPLTKTQDRIIATGMLMDRGLGKAVELAKLEVTGPEGSTEPQVLIIGDQKIVF